MTDNAANEKKKFVLPEGYVPLGNGVKRLDVPLREGYNRRWFNGDPNRIQRALQAGYKFVDVDDVSLNNFDLGGDAKTSGSTDLGTRVSVVSGEGTDGQGQRMYLMECPLELYEYSRSLLAERNEEVASALRGGAVGEGKAGVGENSSDRGARYNKVGTNLFTPKDRS